jgi:hypothetical protein
MVEILEKILTPSCFSFPLRPSREFLNLPKNRQISERSSPLKIPTPHAKLKFCRFLIYNNGLMKNKCAVMCYKVQIQVVDDSMANR